MRTNCQNAAHRCRSSKPIKGPSDADVGAEPGESGQGPADDHHVVPLLADGPAAEDERRATPLRAMPQAQRPQSRRRLLQGEGAQAVTVHGRPRDHLHPAARVLAPVLLRRAAQEVSSPARQCHSCRPG
ncbi:unnamed protein product [Ixodes pacificus]